MNRRIALTLCTVAGLSTFTTPAIAANKSSLAGAAAAVRLKVAHRYEMSTRKVSVDCHKSGVTTYSCTWRVLGVSCPDGEWGTTCKYDGDSTARFTHGRWTVRLFDISRMSY